VKVGSEDYIRRERRALTTEVHDPANAATAGTGDSSVSQLEEDE
jgi:hypothetical protein